MSTHARAADAAYLRKREHERRRRHQHAPVGEARTSPRQYACPACGHYCCSCARVVVLQVGHWGGKSDTHLKQHLATLASGGRSLFVSAAGACQCSGAGNPRGPLHQRGVCDMFEPGPMSGLAAWLPADHKPVPDEVSERLLKNAQRELDRQVYGATAGGVRLPRYVRRGGANQLQGSEDGKNWFVVYG